jgi:glycolate oxidase iron-sulfur subunit
MIDYFDVENLDAIITNAAGCGSHLKHFTNLLRDDKRYASRAREWDKKVKDISEWLVEIEFRAPSQSDKSEETETVTYHEACHLCHGQGISSQPRDVLRSIPGMQLVEMTDATHCCGSAGVYNITQPEQAGKLQQEKVENIKATGASCVATANPGCHLQIQNGLGLNGAGDAADVTHPVSLLAAAYRKEKGDSK